MNLISFIKANLSCSEKSIENVINLSSEGATIPFIARYRKEMTGNIDEVEIESILKHKTDFEALEKRKKFIILNIKGLGELNDKLLKKISNCYDSSRLEDYFFPFKQKKVSLATKAADAGLRGLAKLIMAQSNSDPIQMAQQFIKPNFNSTDKAIEGAKAIIISWINENEIVREKLRDSFIKYSIIISKKSKSGQDDTEKYKNFYDFNQAINSCPSYRLLAIFRGESEKILRVSVRPNADYNLAWLTRFYAKNQNACSEIIKDTLKVAYKKGLEPSLENETRQYFKKIADTKSITNFSKNLNQLLLAPPIGAKTILAIDPGFRTGCKVVCLDINGSLVHNSTVYPHPPKNDKSKASAKIAQLVEMYKIDAIAIGDGTAGRESENWIKHIKFKRNLKIYTVREDGASIYSASKIAREEFPNYDITVRGAVSIGRRLSDPLAELVKIEPKSLGVGQYQHDVNQVDLKNALDFVVVQAVNKVGINLNTASKHLLAYVSGLGPKLAESIVDYRTENGLFKNRESLKNVPRLGNKAFEQSAGFLRIKTASNPLDNSAIHPEQYNLVKQIAKQYKLKIEDLIGNKPILDQALSNTKLIEQIGEFSLKDIITELNKPGLDPRRSIKILEFTPGINSITDLKVGMMINGVITNVTDFGAFVNIGIKQNGLIHKTQMAKHFVDNPTDIVQINQYLSARIIEIDIDRNRIGLSLI